MATIALILRLLDLVVAGTMAFERFNEMKTRLEAMKAEGRDPTPAEWEALFADIDIDSGRLDDADKRLNP